MPWRWLPREGDKPRGEVPRTPGMLTPDPRSSEYLTPGLPAHFKKFPSFLLLSPPQLSRIYLNLARGFDTRFPRARASPKNPVRFRSRLNTQGGTPHARPSQDLARPGCGFRVRSIQHL